MILLFPIAAILFVAIFGFIIKFYQDKNYKYIDDKINILLNLDRSYSDRYNARQFLILHYKDNQKYNPANLHFANQASYNLINEINDYFIKEGWEKLPNTEYAIRFPLNRPPRGGSRIKRANTNDSNILQIKGKPENESETVNHGSYISLAQPPKGYVNPFVDERYLGKYSKTEILMRRIPEIIDLDNLDYLDISIIDEMIAYNSIRDILRVSYEEDWNFWYQKYNNRIKRGIPRNISPSPIKAHGLASQCVIVDTITIPKLTGERAKTFIIPKCVKIKILKDTKGNYNIGDNIILFTSSGINIDKNNIDIYDIYLKDAMHIIKSSISHGPMIDGRPMTVKDLEVFTLTPKQEKALSQ